jgi:hypothetical protein
MNTFTALKPFTINTGFSRQREVSHYNFSKVQIDPPVNNLLYMIKKLPYCYSIQSCCGHFVYGNKDLINTDKLPELPPDERIEYRIAYLAFCIEDSREGKIFFNELKKIPELDEDYIQFGCAEWFWNMQPNSYILQVEPERFSDMDKILVSYPEAVHIELVRNKFIEYLEELLQQKTSIYN